MAAFIARLLAAGIALAGSLSISAATHAAPIAVVAAENVYGDIAQQIGGPDVMVASIVSNPAQDPHLFEAGPSAAMRVAGAAVAIYNGAGYDPWMAKLLAVTPGADRAVIVVADLAGKTSGDNPHLWYDPAFVRAAAKAVCDALSRRDPAGQVGYAGGLAAFDASLSPIAAKIAAMRARYAGTPVTATEPVFDYMANAIGLQMRNAGFQRAVMNGTEPAARDMASFEDDLKGRKVRVLLYNTQATGPLPERMKRLAETAGVPVVGIGETMPPDKHYQDWIAAELDALDAALAKGAQ